MTEPRHTDDLAQRYLEASAQDPRRPPDRVRDAVRAHALDVIAASTPPAPAHKPATDKPGTDRPAANQSRWKISLLASIALAGITGLLVLQFERGTPEEKELALGQAMTRGPSEVAAAPTAPSLPVSPDSSARPAKTPVQPPATPPTLPAATPQPFPQSKQPMPAAKASARSGPAQAETGDLARPEATLPLSPPAPAAAPFAMPAAPIMAAPQPSAQAARAPRRLAEAAEPGGITGGGTSGATNGVTNGVTHGTIAPAPAAAPTADAAMGAARAKASPPQDLKQAMIEAARTGNVAQMESLLQQGAALNAVDETGRTALIWAVINNQTHAVQKLLALGANKTIRDQEGLSALQHAKRLNLDRMAALLEASP